MLQLEIMKKIKNDFPIFQQTMNGHPLIYLDSAATSQKPRAVMHAIQEFYGKHNSNVHRSVHKLGEEASEMFESARKNIANFIGANHREIIFTKNATESLNLAANCISKSRLTKNDLVTFTELEHHSNIVPWLMLDTKKSAVKINNEGVLDEESLNEEMEKNPKVFAFTHVSNAIGTINNAEYLCKRAKEAGALSVVDATQSVPHMPIDVKKLDCDFMAFSGHKMLGPTGIGILYIREELMETLPPFLGGGDMIKEVYLDHFTTAKPPAKFEAGTPPIAEVIGLSAAVDYLNAIGMSNVADHERSIVKKSFEALDQIDKLRIFGPRKNRIAVMTFEVEGVPSHDMASILDSQGIAIRAGHQCAMPVHQKLGIESSNRASFYIYNDEEDVEALAQGIKHAKKVFGV